MRLRLKNLEDIFFSQFGLVVLDIQRFFEKRFELNSRLYALRDEISSHHLGFNHLFLFEHCNMLKENPGTFVFPIWLSRFERAVAPCGASITLTDSADQGKVSTYAEHLAMQSSIGATSCLASLQVAWLHVQLDDTPNELCQLSGVCDAIHEPCRWLNASNVMPMCRQKHFL